MMELVNSNGEEVDKGDVIIIQTRDGSLWSKARWFWLRRTILERVLLVLLLITLVALIVSMVFAIVNNRARRDQEQEQGVPDGDICSDDDCVSIASELISNMNLLIDPCDDFYEYSCGNWLRHNPDTTIPRTVAEEIFKVCQDLLNEGPITQNTDGAIWKTQKFYESCMNRGNIETNGTRQVLDFLDDFGGFHTGDMPYKEDGTNDTDSFTTLLAELILASDEHLLLRLLPSEPSLRIGQTTTTSCHSTHNQMDSQENFIIETMATLYPTGSNATLRRIAADISELATRLENACTNEKNISMVTVTDLQRMIPQINWTRLLDVTLPAGSYNPNEIYLHHREYFNKLGVILKDTSTRVVKEYCMWHIIKYILPYTEGSLREISQHYQKTPSVCKDERGKYCTEMTLKLLEDSVAAMFSKELFDTRILDQASKMYKEIRDTYSTMVNDTDGVDEESKGNIIQIINLTTVKMAYPEYMFDREQLDQAYHKVHIDDHFLTNVLALRKHTKLKSFAEKMPGRIIYPKFSALYNHHSHAVVIPLGSFLRPSLAQYDLSSLLYSSVGISMAHELSHSLDYLIVKDKKVTAESSDVLQHRLDCLLSTLQDDIDANGDVRNDDIKHYQNEARADLAALEISYQAFKKQQKTQILPYLNINADQTFFINFAQMMCGHVSDNKIINGVYPPYKYRVFTSLRNLGEFSTAFKCSRDYPMNPSKKCTMWHHVPIDDN